MELKVCIYLEAATKKNLLAYSPNYKVFRFLFGCQRVAGKKTIICSSLKINIIEVFVIVACNFWVEAWIYICLLLLVEEVASPKTNKNKKYDANRGFGLLLLITTFYFFDCCFVIL